MDNPYYENYSVAMKSLGSKGIASTVLMYKIRAKMINGYSYAVPDQEAIDICVKYGPLIEIGAGLGYWAHLINQAGGEILAFDRSIDLDTNLYFRKAEKFWFDIEPGGPEKVLEYPEHNLFLCWPPFEGGLGTQALSLFKGEYVIYVGESKGGCCASDTFFERLDTEYNKVAIHNIPSWTEYDDNLVVYKRRG